MNTVPTHIGNSRRKLTYRDYLELPDDGRRYELVDGELSVTPAPRTRHQRVSAALVCILRGYVVENGLGEVFHAPTDVILADDCVVEPDLVYVAASRARIISERGIEGAPDLAIEILSESTSERDRTTKMSLYARHGIEHYWIFDPDERVFEAYVRGKRRYRRTVRATGNAEVHAAPLTDLAIDLGKIWR